MLLLCLLAEYFKLSSYNLISWPLMVAHLIMFFKISPEQKDSEAITSAKGYAAPELSDPGAADGIKADIYSFGVILLVLLTGQKAFNRYVFSVLTLLYQSCSLDSEGSFPLQFKKAKRAVSSRLGSSSS